MLLALDHRRCLTARQISRLYYRGESEAIPDPEQRALALAAADRQVNRRSLRPLKDSGLITVVRPFILGEATPLARKEVVVLTNKGANVVKQLYDAAGRGQTVRWRRDWLAIDNTNQVHASLLSDLYILLRRALRGQWIVQGWRDDRDLAQLTNQGQTRLTGMVPDAVFVLAHYAPDSTISYVPFICELDLGTETIVSRATSPRDWTAKIERYRHYFAGAVHADPLWSGIDTPPRVLTLTTSAERLKNLLDATRQAGGAERFWFATLDLLRGDTDPGAALWTARWQSATLSATVAFRDLVTVSSPGRV